MWWVAAAWANGETQVLEAPALRIAVPQGHVSVVADAAATAIALTIDRARWSDACSLTVGVEGTEAVVRGVRTGGPTRTCRADVEARVPPATTVVIDLGNGDVALAGVAGAAVEIDLGDLVVTSVAGKLDAEIGSGNLVGSFVGDALTAKVGGGQVRLAGLVCPADVNVTIGRIELTYAKAPTGVIHLASGAGGATVLLPAGTAVALGDSDARLGKLVNELPVDEASPTVIQAGTHAGNLAILAVSAH
jgi:hypothetical protein